MKKSFVLILFCLLASCKEKNKESIPRPDAATTVKIEYAKGFTIENSDSGLTVIRITSPWPEADIGFTYALVPKDQMAALTLNKDAYDAIIAVPVNRVVVTSTTHIPALEALGVSDRLVGFPNTDYISSEATRKLVDIGLVKELGNNESLNTEIVIGLQPEVVVGFGISNENKAYETIKQANIPVVYNGDWTEESPLGKAEWIKFFAPFFGKEKLADSIFGSIETSYNEVKSIAENAIEKPTVLTGGLFKDVWHVAGGRSWMAQFLEDAHTDYLWSTSKETGAIALSLESVLETAKSADYWLNPSMLVSYGELVKANRHYEQFDAFSHRRVYSNTIVKGATGGLLFYELAPQRPDLVLKDLVHIFHSELFPQHEPVFFKPLE
ncbi:MAG: ABC transporter substrate-binding protein [Pricia sp.]|nr:ABC transporter substrate-binding protein [Pricia sp.]